MRTPCGSVCLQCIARLLVAACAPLHHVTDVIDVTMNCTNTYAEMCRSFTGAAECSRARPAEEDLLISSKNTGSFIACTQALALQLLQVLPFAQFYKRAGFPAGEDLPVCHSPQFHLLFAIT